MASTEQKTVAPSAEYLAWEERMGNKSEEYYQKVRTGAQPSTYHDAVQMRLRELQGTQRHMENLSYGYATTEQYQALRQEQKKYEQLLNDITAGKIDGQKKYSNEFENEFKLNEVLLSYGNSDAAINKSGCTLDSSKITSTAEIALSKISENEEQAATSEAESALSKVSDGLSASDSDSIMPEWLTKLGSSVSNTASGFADTAADKASGAANYLSGIVDKHGDDITSFASKAISTATNMVNKVSGLASKATNWFNGLTESFTETDPKKKKKSDVKSAFVASSNKKGVDNSQSPLATLGANLTKLKNKTCDKFAELAGPVDNLKKAAANVKKTVVGTVQSAFKTGAAITKTISNTVSSVLSPAKSLITTARNLTNPNNIQDTVSGALDFLPFGLGDMVGKVARNEAAKYNTKLGMLESRVNGIDSLGTKLQGLMMYNKDSPELLNDGGKLILGLATGDVSKKDLDQLYKAATGYCNNVSTPSYLEFGNNKLVYETLLKQALNSGSSSLVSQLANCGKYFSNETKKNIADEFIASAKKGDVTSLNAMVDIAGKGLVEDPKELVRTLGTNLIKETSGVSGTVTPNLVKDTPTIVSMALDEPVEEPNLIPIIDETTGDIVEYEVKDINKHYRQQYLALVNDLGLTPQELLADDQLPQAYSAEYVTLYARQPELLKDMGMSDTKRNTILHVYTHYMTA